MRRSRAPSNGDVKRLAASLEVAFRGNGVSAARRSAGVAAAVRTYRERMAEYAALRTLDVWYSRIAVDEVIDFFPRKYRSDVLRDVAKSRSRTSLRASSKLTRVVDGRSQFIEDPPLITRLENTGHEVAEVVEMIEHYRASLSHDVRTLFDRFPRGRHRAQGRGGGLCGNPLLGRAARGPALPRG